MYAILLRFPAGRYHATGWDHHVNEGTVEWPPSPLRLQRALVATGFKLGWEPERIRTAALSLAGLPRYRLPRATAGHTRHYMPTGGIPVEKSRTLVFDAFYAFERDATLGVAWPDADPSPAVRADLDVLWRSTGYLGRAESWAEGEPAADIGEPDAGPAPEGFGDVRLLALETAEAFAAWQGTLAPASKKPKRGAAAPPADLWAVLTTDIGALQKAGWSRPPGVREVAYALAHPPLVASALRRAERPIVPRTRALFALASAVPARIERTVSVADRVRRACMSRSTWHDDAGHRLEERRPDPDPLLSGKDADGVPLTGHHHAAWLPFSSTGGRELDRLLVSVPGGLSPRAVEALRSLRRVWGDQQHDLHLVLLGTGEDARVGAAPLLGPGREWVTDTPFVPTRHPKPSRGTDLVPDQIRTLLAAHGLPAPSVVEPLAEATHGVPWHAIRAVREGGGARAARSGYGVRLVFDRPVEGPIAIGWGAHFGMGRFRCVDPS